MTPHEWDVFGGFAFMLLGLSIFNPRLAAIVGGGVAVVVLLQHPELLGQGGPVG